MTELRIQGIALLAMLAALPIIAVGANSETPAMTVIGVVLFSLAALTPPALRYAPVGSDQEDEE